MRRITKKEFRKIQEIENYEPVTAIELQDKIKQEQDARLLIYKKLYIRVDTLIKESRHTFKLLYKVPFEMIEDPNYNRDYAKMYLMHHLQKNKFRVMDTDQGLLIDWTPPPQPYVNPNRNKKIK